MHMERPGLQTPELEQTAETVEHVERRHSRDLTWRLMSTLAVAADTARPAEGSPFHPARALANPRVEAVGLTYTIRPSGGAGLTVATTARVVETSIERLAESAEQTRDVMRTGLATLRPAYEFGETVCPGSAPETWPGVAVWRLMPRGVHVPSGRRRRAGFDAHDESRQPGMLLALPTEQRGSVSVLLQLLSRSSGQVSLTLGIERVVLSERSVAALDHSLHELRRGAGVSRPMADGSWFITEDGPLSEVVQHVLASWLRQPVGYRIVCELRSDEDARSLVDAGLMAGLFPGLDIVAVPCWNGESTASGAADHGPHADIDLRNCVTDIDRLPEWLPSRHVLSAVRLPRHYPGCTASVPREGATLGTTSSGAVRLAPGDRARHVYICGSTGTGKSTLLFNLIVQDIESGGGVAVLDPHGDLYDALLGAIPRGRLDDVVVIEPGRGDWAVGLNFIECRNGDRRREVAFLVNEMVKIFECLYDMRQVGGPIFEQYMRSALLLLMLTPEYRHATLLDVSRIFEDQHFRQALLARCPDPMVRGFWKRQAERAGGDAALHNMAPYITSKLNQFVTNPLLRPMIGQVRSTIDFRAIMDERKILLVNLARGELGRLDSQLLGMLITGRLLLAAMGRTDVPPERRVPFSVYIDEFQNFTTDSVAQALAEGRKFGLNLTLANQTLSQLEASANRVLEAVLGNCGSTIFFRLGILDASRLEVYTRPDFHAGDLQDLPDFHAATRLLVANHPQPTFVMKTEPRRPGVDRMEAAHVASYSSARFGRLVTEVEEEIARRWVADPFADGEVECAGAA